MAPRILAVVGFLAIFGLAAFGVYHYVIDDDDNTGLTVRDLSDPEDRCSEEPSKTKVHCVQDGETVEPGTIAVIEVIANDDDEITIAYGELKEEFTPERVDDVDRNAWVGYKTVSDAHEAACNLVDARKETHEGYKINGPKDCDNASKGDDDDDDNSGKGPKSSSTPAKRNVTIPKFDNDEDKTLPSLDTEENTREDVEDSTGVTTEPLGTWVWNGNRPAYPATPESGEWIVAHGDINSSGTCHYIVFEAGEKPGGLGDGTFNMYRISGEQKAVYNEIDRHFDEVNVGMVCPMLRADDNKFIAGAQ